MVLQAGLQEDRRAGEGIKDADPLQEPDGKYAGPNCRDETEESVSVEADQLHRCMITFGSYSSTFSPFTFRMKNKATGTPNPNV